MGTEAQSKAKFIVLLGAPGAGKGTQAAYLEEELGIPHVSSGDLFRENLREETELGKLARTYICLLYTSPSPRD